MPIDAEFRRELEQAMRDDDRLLAAMRALLEQAWEFVSRPGAEATRTFAAGPA